MNELYWSMFWIALAVVLVFQGGFLVGFFLADNRRKADDAFNPKVRPDRYHETR